MAVKMKSREVESITTHEENLRFRIYEGLISVEAAGAELLENRRLELNRLSADLFEKRDRLDRSIDHFLMWSQHACGSPGCFAARLRMIWVALTWRQKRFVKQWL